MQLATREAKLEERLQAHIASYRKRALVEAEDRAAQHSALDTAFREGFSRLEASAAASAQRYPAEAASVRAQLQEEAALRSAGDAASVEAMSTAVESIRRAALENYGLEEEED